MPGLPPGLDQAFAATAGELGMCAASWLFVSNVAAEGGDALVAELRDALGRAYPVLDAVAAQWMDGTREQALEIPAAAQACAGARRIVVVGLEANALDGLVAALPDARFALLTHSQFEVSWPRVLANYAGRVEPVTLESYQGWAGARSVLLTFAYGVHGARTHALPEWLRASGEDVRAQFRSLVAWDVLRGPMFVYPRWLVQVDTAAFTQVISG